jgi:hypothetical protein
MRGELLKLRVHVAATPIEQTIFHQNADIDVYHQSGRRCGWGLSNEREGRRCKDASPTSSSVANQVNQQRWCDFVATTGTK